MNKIEWLCRPGTKPESWNPVSGCTKVSAGCARCYAETLALRFWGEREFSDVRCHEDRLDAPLHWRSPRTVFVNSMSDLFHPYVSDEFIDRVFAVMALCPQHTFIVLTKRPERMRDYFCGDGVAINDRVGDAIAREWDAHGGEFPAWLSGASYGWEPLPNVWLGVSIENQETADERIPILLDTPAAVRFVSAEPLLGTVNLRTVMLSDGDGLGTGLGSTARGVRLDWLIVGGESGQKARPCDVAWIRSLVGQAKDAKVPCFVKQLGAFPCAAGPLDVPNGMRVTAVSGGTHIVLRHGKGADPTEWPKDLRVREWPR